ncbi:MAG: TonB-dependent receptor [Mucilaginibacter sp.]
MISSLVVTAQTRHTGKVISSDDKLPVVGASVRIKGTNTGAVTDVNGDFSINVSPGNVLVISYIGYQTKELTVQGGQPITISLLPTNSTLNEVVVTGYTAQRKKDIIGAVSVVNVKDLKQIPAGSPAQALQGKASGLTVITSGEPGGNTILRVRGISTPGNNNPLVLIDGVQGSLDNININDIESVQVLKDAGASSIYGVRGSNGVIVVTTKKGNSGKTTISYDGYYGTQVPPSGNVFHLLNTQGMADVTWLALRNSNQLTNGNPSHPQYGNGANPVIPDYILIGGNSGVVGQPSATDIASQNFDYSKGGIFQIVPANKVGTDWFHEIFKTAPIQSHTVTGSGGNDKSTYLFSLGYFDQQGTEIDTYLKRYSARVNTTFSVNNHIRFGENVYLFNRVNPHQPAGNLSEGNPISMAYREQPIIPVYDQAGGFAGTAAKGLGNAQNPVALLDRTKTNHGDLWDIQGNVFGEVDFLKHFTFRSSYGGTLDNQYYYSYNYRSYENAENNGANSFFEGAQYNKDITFTNTLKYSQIFGKHNIQLLAGTESNEKSGRGLGGNTVGYFTDDPNYHTLSTGAGPYTNSSYVYGRNLYSLFARADYSYNDRYLLSATVRRDGSSAFGPQNRYGVFPSVSLGWRISQESFMRSIAWINDLKIRGSYGILGNDLNVDPANSFNQYGGNAGSAFYDINGTSTTSVQGFQPTRLGNPRTKWEQDKLGNVGLDASLFNSKLDLSVEYYKKSISGLLFGDQAPATVGGASLPQVNIGNVENKGIDASATYHGAVHDITFDIGGTFTSYKNKVVSVPGGYFESGGSRIGNFVRNEVGYPLGSFFGYKVVGLFQSQAEADASGQDGAGPGRFKYQDTNGDGKITAADRTHFGNPNPDFTYGLNLGLGYKGFDFSAFFYGSQGNQIINYVKYWTDFYPSFQGAKSIGLLNNSWLPTRPNAKIPIAENNSNFSNNQVPNSYYMEDGSFLKLKSLIIGYSFAPAVLKQFGITKLRVYVQGANLFTATKYTGLDPELGGGSSAFGIDYGAYPSNQRNYNFGVNLTF